METRANHVLVGSFVLALVAAAVVAALWLSKIELDRTQVRFLIYFQGNVTGLNIGSAVRYRGVPVGNVIDIRIDPENVERVRVLIEVTDDTPVKRDTIASLGIQGITGIAFIQLSGGTQVVLGWWPNERTKFRPSHLRRRGLKKSSRPHRRYSRRPWCWLTG